MFSLREARRRFEIAYFEGLLAKHKWRIVDVARAAGLARGCLYEKLDELGIERRLNGGSPSLSFRQALRAFEIQYFTGLLLEHKWEIAKVAMAAGFKHPAGCYKRLDALGLVQTRHHRAKGEIQ